MNTTGRYSPLKCVPHLFQPGSLCRALCRNPGIPPYLEPPRLMSLSESSEVQNKVQVCTNKTFLYHSDFFGVASCRTALRFDTVEVWGSSSHGPTIASALPDGLRLHPAE